MREFRVSSGIVKGSYVVRYVREGVRFVVIHSDIMEWYGINENDLIELVKIYNGTLRDDTCEFPNYYKVVCFKERYDADRFVTDVLNPYELAIRLMA